MNKTQQYSLKPRAGYWGSDRESSRSPLIPSWGVKKGILKTQSAKSPIFFLVWVLLSPSLQAIPQAMTSEAPVKRNQNLPLWSQEIRANSHHFIFSLFLPLDPGYKHSHRSMQQNRITKTPTFQLDKQKGIWKSYQPYRN